MRPVYLEPVDVTGWSNRFQLPALSSLDEALIRAFDDKLVVFASTESPYYRVARRGMCPGFVRVRAAHSVDHAVCTKHNLDPVVSVFPPNLSKGNPWPKALDEIAQEDMFRIASSRRAGGAVDNCGNLYTDHQEEREASRERGWQRTVDGEVHARAVDSYGLAMRRSGLRVYMNDPASRERAKASNIRLDLRPGGSSVRVPGVRQAAEGEPLIVLASS